MADFGKVEDAVQTAKGIAWDTCHKIYVLMDDEQMNEMKEYGYDPLISSDQMSPDEMLETIQKWYSESCGLRFVSSVETNHEDQNEGFKTLIGQFEDQDEEDEEDEEEGEDEDE